MLALIIPQMDPISEEIDGLVSGASIPKACGRSRMRCVLLWKQPAFLTLLARTISFCPGEG
jgi:hypothetical protein